MNYKNYNDDDNISLEAEFRQKREIVETRDHLKVFLGIKDTDLERKIMGSQELVQKMYEMAVYIGKGAIEKEVIDIVVAKTKETATYRNICLLESKSIQLIMEAIAKVEERNLKINTVEPKILIGLSEGIVLETDLVLQEMYTNLLAAAISGEQISPDEVQILKEIGTNEIKILEVLFKSGNQNTDNGYILVVTKLISEDYEVAVDRLIAKGLIKPTVMQNIEAWRTNIGYGLTKDRGVAEYIGGESLRAADLEAIEASFKMTMNTLIDLQTIDKYRSIGLTKMGQNFMKKCKGVIEKPIEPEQNS